MPLPLGAAGTTALEAAVVELQRDLDALQVRRLPPCFCGKARMRHVKPYSLAGLEVGVQERQACEAASAKQS